MAIVTLAAFSAVAGVLILLVFKAISNHRALAAARRKARAHLFAIRLFADDPRLILRSQGQLFAWTARYVALLLPAFFVISIPLFFAWDRMNDIWGHVPLAPGETVILTARLSDSALRPRLVTPDWLPVESPPVRVESENEVSWRLRVSRAGSGIASVIAGDEHASKRIEARPGLHYLPDRERAAGGSILWLEMRYPRSEMSWPVWFFIISTVTALAFRSRLRVTL